MDRWENQGRPRFGQAHRELSYRRVPWLRVKRRQAVPDDFRRYLLLCMKADALRRRGIQAEVRGRKRRWLILIKGHGV